MAGGQQRQILRNSALAAAVAAIAAPFTGGQSLTAFFVTFGTTYALGTYAASKAGKGLGDETIERKVMLRSSAAPHRIVFGQALISGVLSYGCVTGANKEHIHLIIALTGHKMHSVGDIYLNDERLPTPDGSGNITSGTYAGLVKVRVHLGDASQTADADMIAAAGGQWTSAHRGDGIGYLYIRLQYDENKFPTGLPDIRVLARGEVVYDPGTGTSKLSDNPSLLLRHYMRAAYGFGVDASELDDTAIAAAANTCDEWIDTGIASVSVTVDTASDEVRTTDIDPRLSTGDRIVLGGTTAPTGTTLGATYYLIRRGPKALQLATSYQNAIEGVAVDLTTTGTAVTITSVHQKRYVARGSFTLDVTPSVVEEQLRLAMAGHHVFAAGVWRQFAGAFESPTRTITEDDLRGTLTYKGRRGGHDVTNTIRGQFVDPTNFWTMTDYPAVSDATYITEDGGQVAREVEQPWCDNSFRAQRIAKIMLRRSRQPSLVLPCKINALRLATATTVAVTHAQLGLSAAPFRVLSLKISGEDGGVGIDLALEGTASTDFDWSPSDGVAPLVSTPVVLPDARVVGAPTGLALASGNAELLKGDNGVIVSRIRVSWFHAQEPNPAGYRVEWQRSGDTTWTRATVGRTENSTFIAPVEDGAAYDVRVQTFNAVGVGSAWVSDTHTVAGKTAAPTAPTTITVMPAAGGYDISWTASPDADYHHTELWEASTNDRATATKLLDIAGNRFSRSGVTGGSTRYYWVRDVDTSGNVSTWLPVGATSGAGAIAGSASIPVVGTIPTTTYLGDVVYCNADENLYVWSGAAYVMSDPFIAAARIVAASLSAISADLGSITAGSIDIASLFQVTNTGAVLLRNATSGARMEIRNNVIKVFDSSGTLRVKLGDLSA